MIKLNPTKEEKTIARIDIEVKNKEQEKSKMFKEEVSE